MMRKLGLLFCVELLFLGRGLLPRPAGSQMMRLIWPHSYQPALLCIQSPIAFPRRQPK